MASFVRSLFIVAAASLTFAATLYAEAPRINGPSVYGAHPGSEFMYKVPASGTRPVTFAAKGLPDGLTIDSRSGIISGTTPAKGEYKVELKVTNAQGSSVKTFRIVAGERLALTPPMGWSSRNCCGSTVSRQRIEANVKALLEKGLDRYGWTYINIDDGWQGLRTGENGALDPNAKFPDMEGLSAYIHSNGLKFGLYSTPWACTYGGYAGEGCDRADGVYWWADRGMVDANCKVDKSKLDRTTLRTHTLHSFAEVDAARWADWKVDFLKYDWRPNDEYHIRRMRAALDSTGRDIIYSVANDAPVGVATALYECAQMWRIGVDVRDEWSSVVAAGFEKLPAWAGFCGPGHWPDADMLVIGKVGWGPKTRPSLLTQDEQMSHMTLWAIAGAPLILGCDLVDIDPFTLSLITNPEVIDVNQDALGIFPTLVERDSTHCIYAKPLEDGSVALAMFNLTREKIVLGISPEKLGFVGDVYMRDVWEREDVSRVGSLAVWSRIVQPHGVFFVKITPVVKGAQPL